MLVTFSDDVGRDDPIVPRCYTLTHSDSTGDLFLTIGSKYDSKQVSGWYTRFMRDEILAEWGNFRAALSLIVRCHVSGGLVLGRSGWREAIFRRELPLVLESIRYGDRMLFESSPGLDESPIWVLFERSNATNAEEWGILGDFR